MLQQFLTRLFWFVLMVGLQALVFNHIHLLGYATPMPYIYVLLILPNDTARWVYVALGFALGLTIDLFSNTLGAAAATTTLVGLLTPWMLDLFGPDDRPEESFVPSTRTMRWSGFLKYAAFLTIVHTALFFLIESFSLFHLLTLLLNIVGSVLLTLVLIMAIERIRVAPQSRGA